MRNVKTGRRLTVQKNRGPPADLYEIGRATILYSPKVLFGGDKPR